MAAGDTDFPDGPARGVRLLPYFDAYVVAGRPRERLFPGKTYERALGGGQAGNHPVLLVDGVVAGCGTSCPGAAVRPSRSSRSSG